MFHERLRSCFPQPLLCLVASGATNARRSRALRFRTPLGGWEGPKHFTSTQHFMLVMKGCAPVFYNHCCAWLHQERQTRAVRALCAFGPLSNTGPPCELLACLDASSSSACSIIQSSSSNDPGPYSVVQTRPMLPVSCPICGDRRQGYLGIGTLSSAAGSRPSSENS